MKTLFILLLLIGSAQAQLISVAVKPANTSPPTTVTYINNASSSTNAASLDISYTGTVPVTNNFVGGVVWVSTSVTLSTVCDGTGTGACTGSSTYTIEPAYSNSTNFRSYVWFTCKFQGTSATNSVTLTFSGSTQSYGSSVSASGNTTTGTNCLDGYNKAQSTANGTAAVSGTVSTTNANDLMIGLFTNNAGVTYTAGNDSQGHNYTARANDNTVTYIETLGETATGTYSAAATLGSSKWNAEVLAIK